MSGEGGHLRVLGSRRAVETAGQPVGAAVGSGGTEEGECDMEGVREHWGITEGVMRADREAMASLRMGRVYEARL